MTTYHEIEDWREGKLGKGSRVHKSKPYMKCDNDNTPAMEIVGFLNANPVVCAGLEKMSLFQGVAWQAELRVGFNFSEDDHPKVPT
jgi:hypothetical protein